MLDALSFTFLTGGKTTTLRRVGKQEEKRETQKRENNQRQNPEGKQNSPEKICVIHMSGVRNR